MSQTLYPSIRSARCARNKVKLTARVGLALLFIISSVARPASANTIYVTTLQDGVGTGACSLKEAIYSSTLHDTLDGVHGIAIDYTIPDHFISTGCAIGSGNDTIVLPTSEFPPTLLLVNDTSWDAHNPYGPTATPIINSNITIQGYGATLQWVGTGNVRLFAVGTATITTPNGVSSGTGSLALVNIQVIGFQAKGGNGADGGGGGLGAGGAIYVQNGNLTVDNSTFYGNQATGGNGGSGATSTGAGGGGGLGGNGGSGAYATNYGQVNGGGGGGARGNGGSPTDVVYGGGGGGGGTVESGAIDPNVGGPGGYLCGGNGGDESSRGNNGHAGKCPGGGGGGNGAAVDEDILIGFTNQSGGDGTYGGGGGGGSTGGGNGGFGGGGGAGGGTGGFGGGGGESAIDALFSSPGAGGPYGGAASSPGLGGGGAALGGVIFSDNGIIVIRNSTFTNNLLFDGQGAGWENDKADNGGAAGGAIFARDGSLTIINSTISGNQADGSGAGVVVYSDGSANFTLNDTIIANNGQNECYVAGNVNATGAGNLIMSNGSGAQPFEPCPGVVTAADPLLSPLALNPPGNTPTMAISDTGGAFNTADPATSLSTDQRGILRPQDGGYDIGAYEYCPPPKIFGEVTCLGHSAVPPGQLVNLKMETSPAGVGITIPPLGNNLEPTGSDILLFAYTSNPQYNFTGWTGNVTVPSSASTTILMDGPQTLTASFSLCNCVIQAGEYVTVTPGPIVFNPVTKHYAQTVTLANGAPFIIYGPISLVLDNLSANAILSNASGYTDLLWPPASSPYVTASTNLSPGQSVSVTLQFVDTTNTSIGYFTRVLTGPGTR